MAAAVGAAPLAPRRHTVVVEDPDRFPAAADRPLPSPRPAPTTSSAAQPPRARSQDPRFVFDLETDNFSLLTATRATF